MTRLTDTCLEPVMITTNIKELNSILRKLDEQEIAAIHVQTGVLHPLVKVFTVPAGLPMDVKSRFPIMVEPGYTAIRSFFTPTKVAVIMTDRNFNFGKYEEEVLNLLTSALHEVKSTKNNGYTRRLHMVANLEYTFTKVHGENGYKWIRMDGTMETNVRVLDYTPEQGVIYGLRRKNGKFTELVKFDLKVQDINNLAYGRLWETVVNSPVNSQFLDGSKVEVDKMGNLKVELTFDDGMTRGLTMTKDGTIEWIENVEYSVIGCYFTGNRFGIVIRETDGFSVIPPDIAVNLPIIGKRYLTVTQTTDQPRITTDNTVL